MQYTWNSSFHPDLYPHKHSIYHTFGSFGVRVVDKSFCFAQWVSASRFGFNNLLTTANDGWKEFGKRIPLHALKSFQLWLWLSHLFNAMQSSFFSLTICMRLEFVWNFGETYAQIYLHCRYHRLIEFFETCLQPIRIRMTGCLLRWHRIKTKLHKIN